MTPATLAERRAFLLAIFGPLVDNPGRMIHWSYVQEKVDAATWPDVTASELRNQLDSHNQERYDRLLHMRGAKLA
jgi:hypothetical protein